MCEENISVLETLCKRENRKFKSVSLWCHKLELWPHHHVNKRLNVQKQTVKLSIKQIKLIYNWIFLTINWLNYICQRIKKLSVWNFDLIETDLRFSDYFNDRFIVSSFDVFRWILPCSDGWTFTCTDKH